MVAIPDVLNAIIASGLGIYVHDTFEFVFPPALSVPMGWAPRAGIANLVFGITFGRPVDVATDTFIYTSSFGFWHSHPQMREHWDPALMSLMDYEYPHYQEVTNSVPVLVTAVNNTAIFIRWDMTIHYIEVKEDLLPFIRRMWLQSVGVSKEEATEILRDRYGY